MKKFIFTFLFILRAGMGISQAIILSPNGDGGFESGATFAANNWTASTGPTNNGFNDGVNLWNIGTAPTGYTGARCGYISADAGVTHTYNMTKLTEVHLYRRVNLTGYVSPITLSFGWKCYAEPPTWDIMQVWKYASNVNPDASNCPGCFSGAQQLGANYAGQTPWTTTTLSLNSFANQNITLSFYFQTGNAIGSGQQPPPAIDNVYIYQGNSTLPIELVTFQADADNGKVILTWATASERNNDHFTIERTTDFGDITTVATVKGSGNTGEMKSYAAEDPSPPGGISYYRLKQTDFDGTHKYSAWKVVSNRLENSSEISIYPNPTSGSAIVNYRSCGNSPVLVEVYDSKGSVVYSKIENDVTRGDNHTQINFSSLGYGLYMLRLSGDGISDKANNLKLLIQE